MPNHCLNRLTITGPSKDIEEFRSWFNAESFCEKIDPTPKDLLEYQPTEKIDEELAEELIAKYGAVDWYTWRKKNWGTKWDIYDVPRTESGDDWFQVSYQSAWTPCTQAIQKVSKKFSKLAFIETYFECGNGFSGIVEHHNGDMHELYYESDTEEYVNIGESFGMVVGEDYD